MRIFEKQLEIEKKNFLFLIVKSNAALTIFMFGFSRSG